MDIFKFIRVEMTREVWVCDSLRKEVPEELQKYLKKFKYDDVSHAVIIRCIYTGLYIGLGNKKYIPCVY